MLLRCLDALRRASSSFRLRRLRCMPIPGCPLCHSWCYFSCNSLTLCATLCQPCICQIFGWAFPCRGAWGGGGLVGKRCEAGAAAEPSPRLMATCTYARALRSAVVLGHFLSLLLGVCRKPRGWKRNEGCHQFTPARPRASPEPGDCLLAVLRPDWNKGVRLTSVPPQIPCRASVLLML